MKPWVGIALMPELDFISTALPLFESGEIDVIEWSFDTIKTQNKEPNWLALLLNEYSSKGRLIGHGVRFSLLKGAWDKKHEKWLKELSLTLKQHNYRQITEHFGFMTSDNFHKGAPLPVPLNKTTLSIGQDRLKRLQNVAQRAIGIENLAFAFSNDQIKEQGDFLEKLIYPIDGFLILDLHNIWCQSINFNSDALTLIKSYPLDKVKEIHISGGSWAKVKASKNKIRRDTHDEAVPKEVFHLLKEALLICENTEFVIFERLGNTLNSKNEKLQFQKDFKRIKKIVNELKKNENTPSENFEKVMQKHSLKLKPLFSEELTQQQQFIIKTLSKNTNPVIAKELLKNNPDLLKNNWNPKTWEDSMIETAISLIKKWQ